MFKNLFVPAVILLSFTLAVPEILFSQTEEDLDKMISSDNSIVTTKVTSPESKKLIGSYTVFWKTATMFLRPEPLPLKIIKLSKPRRAGSSMSNILQVYFSAKEPLISISILKLRHQGMKAIPLIHITSGGASKHRNSTSVLEKMSGLNSANSFSHGVPLMYLT